MSDVPQQERRIAACLNACQSVSTEDLERYYETGAGIDEALEEASLRNQIKTAQEKDQLLAAMQKIMARLANMLDEDQFAHIEQIATSAGVKPPVAVAVPIAALALLDEIITDLGNGFVACKRCGDQEDTATLDAMDGLRELRAMLDFAQKGGEA